MAKGAPKGHKAYPGAGRPKGSLGNRGKAQAACDALGVDPFAYMAMAVKGDIPCNVCRQRMKTRVKRKDTGLTHERECQSCKGDGWEKLSPDFRGRMAESLAAYLQPKLASTALTGADGAQLPAWQVVIKTNEGK